MQHRLRIERIQLGRPAPPIERLALIASGRGSGSELASRLRALRFKPAPLFGGPVLELGGAFEEKAVQEGALIQSYRRFRVAGVERVLKLPDVTAHELGIQP